MHISEILPPYRFGLVDTLQTHGRLVRTMKAIQADPVANGFMKVDVAKAAIDKVVEEAHEMQDAFERGDRWAVLREAGDLSMSTNMALINLKFWRWALPWATINSINTLQERWPKAREIYSKIKDWPAAWAEVKRGESEGLYG